MYTTFVFIYIHKYFMNMYIYTCLSGFQVLGIVKRRLFAMILVIPRSNMPNELTSVVLICCRYMFLLIQKFIHTVGKSAKNGVSYQKTDADAQEISTHQTKKEMLHHLFLNPGKHNRCCYIHYFGTRNNLADAAKKNPPDCALSAEADIYACHLAQCLL